VIRKPRLVLAALLAAAGLAAGTTLTRAVEREGGDIRWEDNGPPLGVYFYWYEPSFYTGFAPRCQQPERIHLRLGRGNQFRVTIALGPEQIDSYLEDLRLQRQMFEELLRSKVIELTTNLELEKFVQRLDETGVEQLVMGKSGMSQDDWRAKSLQVLQALNPGRVFHIRRPVQELLTRWKDLLVTTPAIGLGDAEARLEAVNAILPGRVNLTVLPSDLDSALTPLLDLAKAADRDPAANFQAYASAAQPFLEKATRGLYPVRDGFVDAWEFTAIYPAGTEQGFVDWQGKKLPDFGLTGVLPLIRRDEGRGAVGMVDYISTNPAYGFISMLCYQHAGGIIYNSIHNTGVRCPLGGTSFLPKAWNTAAGIRSPKRNFQNLWIISRGPVSHGCTRLASGHMSELRHILPSASETIERVTYFRNLPFAYDVFDIDGDGTPEVMGVKYFLAYSTTKDRLPYKAWAPNRRDAYYDWLYTGELKYAKDGSPYFDEAISGQFVGRRAEAGKVYKNIRLYEAEFEPEKIQFYRLIPTSFDGARGIEFDRELRRVAVGYSASRKTLLLK
jgi:hypothetical protein